MDPYYMEGLVQEDAPFEWEEEQQPISNYPPHAPSVPAEQARGFKFDGNEMFSEPQEVAFAAAQRVKHSVQQAALPLQQQSSLAVQHQSSFLPQQDPIPAPRRIACPHLPQAQSHQQPSALRTPQVATIQPVPPGMMLGTNATAEDILRINMSHLSTCRKTPTSYSLSFCSPDTEQQVSAENPFPRAQVTPAGHPATRFTPTPFVASSPGTAIPSISPIPFTVDEPAPKTKVDGRKSNGKIPYACNACRREHRRCNHMRPHRVLCQHTNDSCTWKQADSVPRNTRTRGPKRGQYTSTTKLLGLMVQAGLSNTMDDIWARELAKDKRYFQQQWNDKPDNDLEKAWQGSGLAQRLKAFLSGKDFCNDFLCDDLEKRELNADQLLVEQDVESLWDRADSARTLPAPSPSRSKRQRRNHSYEDSALGHSISTTAEQESAGFTHVQESFYDHATQYTTSSSITDEAGQQMQESAYGELY
ncbi:hypothetical protein BJ878DRAFT_496995 [Calycina marina]|uniref:Zn(2)-C6 fungal-type domain-containing protein n=1 Tax=Calycina marina TaxID=1763456 RepID=A0A9P7Z6C4_9HELO|nr:hypothetical protein BJ878DRAFT_496995 [Calycina marina]